MKDNRWHKAGTNLDRIKYGYDRASNRIWRENPVAQSYSAEFDEIYTYDGSHRLQEMARGTLNVGHTALTSKTFGETWNLDATGNWTAYTRDDDGDLTNDLVQARTANEVNEVNEIGTITNSVGTSWAQPAYSPTGNMITIPQPKDPSKAYLATYDAWNRLVKLEEEVSSVLETVSTYAYDGRKFQITQEEYTDGDLDETRQLYYNNSWQNLEERLASSSGSTGTIQHNIWGLKYIDDRLLKEYCNAISLDKRFYSLTDDNANTCSITHSNGIIAARFSYSLYGQPELFTIGFLADHEGVYKWQAFYAGCDLGGRSELLSMRTRHFISLLGIFIQRDTLPDFPNQYSYADSSPAFHFDPFGTTPEDKGDKKSGIRPDTNDHTTTKGGKGRTKQKHQKGQAHSSKAGHKARSRFKFFRCGGPIVIILDELLLNPSVADAAEIVVGYRNGNVALPPFARRCTCHCADYEYTEIIPSTWNVFGEHEFSPLTRVTGWDPIGYTDAASCLAEEGEYDSEIVDTAIGYTILKHTTRLCAFAGVFEGFPKAEYCDS